MTVFRRPGSKIYRYEFQLGGHRYAKSTGCTLKRDAEAVEAKAKQRLQRQHAGLEGADVADTPRFSEWAEVTHRFQVERKHLKRPKEAANTIRMVLAFWGVKPTKAEPVAGGEYLDLRLGDPIARPELLAQFESWMEARGLSGPRKNHYRSACSMIYKVALLPEYRRVSGVRENPFAHIQRDRQTRRTAILTIEELQHWMTTAPIEVAIAVAIGALAPALRLGNVIALERATHLSPDRSTLTVPHKADRETGRPLTVALPPSLQAMLTALFEQRPDDPFVVPLPATGRKGRKAETPDRYWVFVRLIRQSIEAAGLKYGRSEHDGITFHSLRHTLQTWMARWGLARHERQSGMAHTTSAMTDWYTHLAGTDTLPAARAIDLHLSGLADGVTKRIADGRPKAS